MKYYHTPLIELICLNSADVITFSGEDGELSSKFEAAEGAANGGTFTGTAPDAWGM